MKACTHHPSLPCETCAYHMFGRQHKPGWIDGLNAVARSAGYDPDKRRHEGVEPPDFIQDVIDGLRAEVRRLKQQLDCTYGDTPGLIHCPPDQPCAMHEAERLRESARSVRERLGFKERSPEAQDENLSLED